MILNTEYADIFDSTVIGKTQIDGIDLYIFENGIIFVRVEKYQTLTLRAYELGKAFIATFGAEKRYNFVFHFESFGDISPELRAQRAKPDGTVFALTDAIVISNVSQKLIADFYMKFNRPKRPTKVFTSLEKAVLWSHRMKKQKPKKDL